ncbi:MAG: hypothetical protein U1E66_10135 [Rhodospirillales bacterium]
MQVPSRREFIEKAAYVAPVILTLQAAPALAKPGSVKPQPPRKGPPRRSSAPSWGFSPSQSGPAQDSRRHPWER